MRWRSSAGANSLASNDTSDLPSTPCSGSNHLPMTSSASATSIRPPSGCAALFLPNVFGAWIGIGGCGIVLAEQSCKQAQGEDPWK